MPVGLGTSVLLFIVPHLMRSATRPLNVMYRSVLDGNSVQIDSAGRKIPAEIRVFLDKVILGKSSLKMSA